jgi:outer membrane protein TolC
VAAAVSATEIGTGQYQRGTINFTPVFQLQTTQVTVQDQLAVAQGNVALNLIEVYRALGGGWEIRILSTPDLCGMLSAADSAAVPTTPELTAPRVLTK